MSTRRRAEGRKPKDGKASLAAQLAELERQMVALFAALCRQHPELAEDLDSIAAKAELCRKGE